jgi:hypothetical protein
LTISSTSSSFDPSALFEYSRDKAWWSKNEPNQWLLFDLKGLSFKIEKICFDVYMGEISRHWRLLGSNDNKLWITIHDQGIDQRCTPNKNFIVEYNIQTNCFFTYFKYEQLDVNYNSSLRLRPISMEKSLVWSDENFW